MRRTRREAPLREVVRAAQTGDLESFDELVLRFQDMAVGYAHARLGDPEEAADAAQDAFVEAWQEIPKLRHPAAFTVWLRRILHKQCDRRLRRRRPADAASAMSPGAETPPDSHLRAERGERAARLRRAIAELSEERRIVTLLHYFAGLSVREIAVLPEIPPGTVKTRAGCTRHAARCAGGSSRSTRSIWWGRRTMSFCAARSTIAST